MDEATQYRFSELERRMTNMETNVATKADLAALRGEVHDVKDAIDQRNERKAQDEQRKAEARSRLWVPIIQSVVGGLIALAGAVLVAHLGLATSAATTVAR